MCAKVFSENGVVWFTDLPMLRSEMSKREYVSASWETDHKFKVLCK